MRNVCLKVRLGMLVVCVALLACSGAVRAQSGPGLAPDVREKVDRVVSQGLVDFGVPSASIAIVKDGNIVYTHAYGDSRLEPRTPARAEMRYSIGSISKQFTSTAILMLEEQGKLSLDDKVAKYLPDLTRANEVTIRQLLSHTSGYQDYWPQDYVPPFMSHAVTAQGILDIWAKKALDFDPGTKWQYSNTNYVIAGVIVEKVSGMPLLQFLQERVFGPLGMERVQNIDMQKLGDTDATGYMRYALGPPRPAPKEGPGWLFAAGELAMPAEQLARWDIGMIEQKLLKPGTYKEMQMEVRLIDGGRTGYALGLQTGIVAGHRALRHGGEVSGFTAQNTVFPDDHAAVVVLTNQDSNGAAGSMGRSIAQILFVPENPATEARLQLAKKVFNDLQHGKIDRSLFTDNANAYFTDEAIKDFATSLGPLGEPQEFTQRGEDLRGGMTFRGFQLTFRNKTLEISIYEMPDGKFEQFLVIATI